MNDNLPTVTRLDTAPGDPPCMFQQREVRGTPVLWNVGAPGDPQLRDAKLQVAVDGHALIVPAFRMTGEPEALWVPWAKISRPGGTAVDPAAIRRIA